MKTCNDCIYYENQTCKLNPTHIDVAEPTLYWCGQLKEEVYVISDFKKDDT